MLVVEVEIAVPVAEVEVVVLDALLADVEVVVEVVDCPEGCRRHVLTKNAPRISAATRMERARYRRFGNRVTNTLPPIEFAERRKPWLQCIGN